MRNNSKAKLAMEDGDLTFRQPENRRWKIGCIVLALCCVALLIAVSKYDKDIQSVPKRMSP